MSKFTREINGMKAIGYLQVIKQFSYLQICQSSSIYRLLINCNRWSKTTTLDNALNALQRLVFLQKVRTFCKGSGLFVEASLLLACERRRSPDLCPMVRTLIKFQGSGPFHEGPDCHVKEPRGPDLLSIGPDCLLISLPAREKEVRTFYTRSGPLRIFSKDFFF